MGPAEGLIKVGYLTPSIVLVLVLVLVIDSWGWRKSYGGVAVFVHDALLGDALLISGGSKIDNEH